MVPDGWKLTTLEKLGTFDRPTIKAGPFGSSLKKEFYVKSGYKVYGQEQVIAGDLSIGNYYIDSHRFESLKSCAVQPGDVLISLVGTFGKAVVVPNEAESGIINPRLIRLSFDSSKVYPFFIKEWLVSPTTQNLFNDVAHGGTMGVLNAQTLKSLQLLLPPLPEQKKIAAILNSVDEAIASTQAVINQTRKVKQGLLQQLLTRGIGHTEFKQSAIGKIPERWNVKTLSDVVAPEKPITYGIVQAGPHIADGIPYIRVSDMTGISLSPEGMLRTSPEIAERYKRSAVACGDIVYALRGNIGCVLPVPPSLHGANLTQGTARISPGINIDSNYLLWTLRSPLAIKQAQLESKGSTFKEISLEKLRKIEIPVPPMEEQNAIAQIMAEIEASNINNLKSLETLQQLKRGLMQDLLTGRVRVGGTA